LRRRTAIEALAGPAGASALGAAAMYLLDPSRGKARRARLRDGVVSRVRRAARTGLGALRDLGRRAGGLAAEARSRLAGAAVDDDVLAERVRARVGHVVAHPHGIAVTVRGGLVALTGSVRSGDRARLTAAVAAVRGVRAVEDRLVVVLPSDEAAGPAVHISS
jgi:osmotically-inducible protein OsmY